MEEHPPQRAPQGQHASADEPVQLSLLHGFTPPASPVGKSQPAPELPIARVLLDSPLPHLDRPFDYLVPAELSEAAAPGVRVKVRFGGQEMAGFLTERLASTDTTARLVDLGKVVSPVPVLSPEVLSLAQAVAARYAGSVHDVLRVAVPPRVARVEKEFADRTPVARTPEPEVRPGDPVPPEAESEHAFPENPYRRYPHGPRFLSHLAAGHSPARYSAHCAATVLTPGRMRLPQPWKPPFFPDEAPLWWFRTRKTWPV